MIAEPAMLARLEEAVSSEQTCRSHVPALCVAHVMATAVVRFRHVQRSKFLYTKEEGAWFRCALGKAKADGGVRTGFLWFAPAATLGEPRVTSQPVLSELHQIWTDASSKRGEPLPYLAMDGVTGKGTFSCPIPSHRKGELMGHGPRGPDRLANILLVQKGRRHCIQDLEDEPY